MTIDNPDLAALLRAILAALPTAAIIAAGAVLLNLVVRRGLRILTDRTSFTEHELTPVQRLMKWLITIIALVMILGAFGLNVGGLWGVLSTILAMVAIGFVAVWSVLSNTLCTLIIVIFRPFLVGDEIEMVGDPVKGRVVDLNFVYTTLDAGDGSILQVPNNLFFQKVIRRRQAAMAVSPAAHLRAKRPEGKMPAAPSTATAGAARP